MKLGQLLLVFLLALGSIAATTAPSTAPSVDPAEAYRDALALIRQGKLVEGQNLLMQADRAMGRGARVDNSQHADVVYAQAVCSMFQGEYQKAHQAFDRIRLVRNKDRSFVLNDVKTDLAIKNLAPSAVKPMDVYLGSLSTPDEEAVDLFGAAIDKAKEAGANNVALTSARDAYVKYNAQLEHTRPGMHHYGQMWMTDPEFATVEDQRRDAQARIDHAQRQVNSAQDSLTRAKANYDSDARQINLETAQRQYNDRAYRYSRTVNPNPVPVRANFYEASVESATADLNNARAKLREAQDSHPHPTFTANLQPIIPDDWPQEVQTAKVPEPQKVDPPPAPAAHTFQDVIQSMATEVGPAHGATWKQLNIDLGQKWLQANVVSKPITLTANYTSGNLRPDGTVEVVCSLDTFALAGLTIASTRFTAQLVESESAKAAKLIPGHPFTATGQVTGIKIAVVKDDPTNVHVEARMSGVTLIP